MDRLFDYKVQILTLNLNNKLIDLVKVCTQRYLSSIVL